MRQAIKGQKVTWIDIENPAEEDVNFLRRKFKLHPLVLGELIPPGHRPKVEPYDKYLFMVFYYPMNHEGKKIKKSGEVDIIVTKDTVITSHYRSVAPVTDLFNACRQYKKLKEAHMSQGAGPLLFYILSSFWKTCLTELDKLDEHIDEIERAMFHGKEKEMVAGISYAKTDIINFWRVIEPQKEILESLSQEGIKFFGQELAPYFADILGTYGKAINSIKTYKETILALEDTNQSMLSTKTNEIIKILTGFSMIILPLTLLTGIWGMNVALPLGGHKLGFWIIAGAMFFLTTLMFFYFRRKKWL